MIIDWKYGDKAQLQGYVGLGYWGDTSCAYVAIIVVTPAERTLIVSAEARTMTVENEARTIIVPFEDRLIKIV